MADRTTGRTPAEGADPMVDHPTHYNSHPSGIECIDLIEHLNNNVGSAVKYIFRLGEKGKPVQDLEKAIWFLRREHDRLRRDGTPSTRPPETTWSAVIHAEENPHVRSFYRLVRSGQYLTAAQVLEEYATRVLDVNTLTS